MYDAIVRDYNEFSQKLDIHDITFIPICALEGDNVTTRSANSPWYDGQTLLHILENVHVAADTQLSWTSASRCRRCCGRTWTSAGSPGR